MTEITGAQIVLTSEERRVEAAKWISGAPPGTRVVFKGPKRTLPQNDRMWAMLSDVSTQLRWHGQHLTANDWKLVFLDALDKETRTCPDIYGIGRVNLGRSSSDLSKDEMNQLMELMAAFGSQHGVKFHDDPIDHIDSKPGVPKSVKTKLSRAEVMAKARAAKAAKATEKAAGGRSQRVAPPSTKPAEAIVKLAKPERKVPATTDDYVAYAQEQILANKGKVSPAIMETWFLSPHEVRLRQDCKVGQLATQLLHSLIKESA